MLSPLHTDLYQLTMANAYWKQGMADDEAVFHLFFRSLPFEGGFALTAGLEQALDFIAGFQFSDDELTYLSDLAGSDKNPLFDPGFIDYLRQLKLRVDVFAIPEGTPVFPNEPILRVQGPILDCQLLETALLNIVNFQTLIATKAARIVMAASGDEVIEFGLRRAQGPDGGFSAARAAIIGGCSSTSNVLAAQKLGVPARGTIAHSWIQAFEDEVEAFEAYAEAMPNNCLLLIDTYDTLEGARRAARVGKNLEKKGYRFLGVRLDSGDLDELSRRVRSILDEAGLNEAVIVASNELDEYRIAELKKRQAPIDIWGVGTRLVTAYDQPSIGGVYKLAAFRKQGVAEWEPRIKLSETPEKTSIPGLLQVRRLKKDNRMVDIIYSETDGIKESEGNDLLIQVVEKGEMTYSTPLITEIQDHAQRNLKDLPRSMLRLKPEDQYPVYLEPALKKKRKMLIQELEDRG